jgi:hypothetical protein
LTSDGLWRITAGNEVEVQKTSIMNVLKGVFAIASSH